jgi:hypothetical protein
MEIKEKRKSSVLARELPGKKRSTATTAPSSVDNPPL